MIAYEDLVAALASWRARNGLPTGPADYLGEPPPPAPVSFEAYEDRSADEVVNLSDESLDAAVLEEAPVEGVELEGFEEAAERAFGEQEEWASGDRADTRASTDLYGDETAGAQGDFMPEGVDFGETAASAEAPAEDAGFAGDSYAYEPEEPLSDASYGAETFEIDAQEATEIVSSFGPDPSLPETTPMTPVDEAELSPPDVPSIDETAQVWPAPLDDQEEQPPLAEPPEPDDDPNR